MGLLVNSYAGRRTSYSHISRCSVSWAPGLLFHRSWVYTRCIESGRQFHLLLLVRRRMPCLVFSWALGRLFSCSTQSIHNSSARPHADLLLSGLHLCIPILLFEFPKLRPRLGFVHSRKSVSQHFQPHISPNEPFPHVDLSHRPVVLVAPEDVCAHAPVVNVCGKPLKCFFRIRLRFSSKMRKFWGIDTCNSYVYLCRG
jgi:hypothetical protein